MVLASLRLHIFPSIVSGPGDVLASVWIWMFLLGWCSVSPQLLSSLGLFSEKGSYIFHQCCQRYTLTNLLWDWEYQGIPGQPSRLSCSQAPSLTSSFLHMNPLELLQPRRGTGVGHSAAPSFEVLLSTDLSSRAISVRSRYEHQSLFIPKLWDHIYSQTLRRLTSRSLRSIPTYPTMAKTALSRL